MRVCLRSPSILTISSQHVSRQLDGLGKALHLTPDAMRRLAATSPSVLNYRPATVRRGAGRRKACVAGWVGAWLWAWSPTAASPHTLSSPLHSPPHPPPRALTCRADGGACVRAAGPAGPQRGAGGLAGAARALQHVPVAPHAGGARAPVQGACPCWRLMHAEARGCACWPPAGPGIAARVGTPPRLPVTHAHARTHTGGRAGPPPCHPGSRGPEPCVDSAVRPDCQNHHRGQYGVHWQAHPAAHGVPAGAGPGQPHPHEPMRGGCRQRATACT